MSIKTVNISEQVHNLVKAHAALLNMSIRDYIERALERELRDSPISNGQMVFLQPPEDIGATALHEQ